MRDPVLWNDWHVVADVTAMRPGETHDTRLLGMPLAIRRAAEGATILAGEQPLAHQVICGGCFL